MSDFSETFRTVEVDYDDTNTFTDPELLHVTSGARLYRARKAGKFVILKTTKNGTGRELELLKREYELSLGFTHPHIIQVYTYEPYTIVGPAIVMEYVDGRNLADYLTEHPSLSARIRIFEQLLEAVGCLHQADVIHNDLKPQNLLITRANDDLKLIDFGLSDNSAHYQQKLLGGTPRYASPELLEQKEDTDARSDIYSIGKIMVDLFDHRYSAISNKCLQPERNRRYANIDALRQAWQRRKLPFQICIGLLFAAAIIVPSALYVSENLHRTQLESIHKHQIAYYDSVTTALHQQMEDNRLQALDTIQKITATEKGLREQMEKEIYVRQHVVDSINHLFDTHLQAAFRRAQDSVNHIPYREFAFSPVNNFVRYSWQLGNEYTASQHDASIHSQLTSHFDALRNQLQTRLYDQVNKKSMMNSQTMSEDEYLHYQNLLSEGKSFTPYRKQAKVKD